MKHHVGKPDPKYGGIVTNVCELPIGTKFYVRNGAWTGTICQDEIGKYVHIGGCSPRRFKDGDKNYLAIDLIEDKIKNNEVTFNNLVSTKVNVEIINPCSICRNDNSKICDDCVKCNSNILPSNFMMDSTKITPYFVHSYYEMVCKYSQLLNNMGVRI